MAAGVGGRRSGMQQESPGMGGNKSRRQKEPEAAGTGGNGRKWKHEREEVRVRKERGSGRLMDVEAE